MRTTTLTSKYFGGVMGAVAIVAVFFVVVNFGMHMGVMREGDMSDCPLAGNASAVCQMNATEHISVWQTTFSVPISKTLGLILSSLFILILFLYGYQKIPTVLQTRRIFYLKQLGVLKSVDYLRSLFSDGVLNPKLYSFVPSF